MYDAVTEEAKNSDIIIKAAAVADYTPLNVSDNKIKKKDGDMSIALKRTKDIIGSSILSSPVIIVTTLVSVPKPATATFTLLATIISIFFLISLSLELAITFSVSIENPHINCPSFLCSPSVPIISFVRLRAKRR